MSTSDVSLSASMRSNLLELQQTSRLTDRTQTSLSTGKRVNTAIDGPTNYFAAKQLSQRASDLNTLKDSFSEAVQTIKTADKGITQISSLLDQAQRIVTSSKTATEDEKSSLDAQLKDVVSQFDQLAKDSSYNGRNLLTGESDMTVSFNESGSSKLTIKSTDLQASALGLDTLSMTDEDAIEESLKTIDSARSSLRSSSQVLSSNLNIITTREDFTKDYISSLEQGASKLTLADLNEEGANLTALQTRQQLGVQSLSMASQSSQALLSLFR